MVRLSHGSGFHREAFAQNQWKRADFAAAGVFHGTSSGCSDHGLALIVRGFEDTDTVDEKPPMMAVWSGGRAWAASQVIKALAAAQEAGVDTSTAVWLVEWDYGRSRPGLAEQGK